METIENVVNSEAVEETVEAANTAVEELASANRVGAGTIAMAVGVGVLAGVITCKYVVPKVMDKFWSRHEANKFVYTAKQPTETDEETDGEDDEEESGEETSGK